MTAPQANRSLIRLSESAVKATPTEAVRSWGQLFAEIDRRLVAMQKTNDTLSASLSSALARLTALESSAASRATIPVQATEQRNSYLVRGWINGQGASSGIMMQNDRFLFYVNGAVVACLNATGDLLISTGLTINTDEAIHGRIGGAGYPETAWFGYLGDGEGGRLEFYSRLNSGDHSGEDRAAMWIPIEASMLVLGDIETDVALGDSSRDGAYIETGATCDSLVFSLGGNKLMQVGTVCQLRGGITTGLDRYRVHGGFA